MVDDLTGVGRGSRARREAAALADGAGRTPMANRLSEFDRRVDRLEARADRLESELAVWRRHGVQVTEDCGTFRCLREGAIYVDPGMVGSVVADGLGMSDVMVMFPASWLEGAPDD